jgi:hypothetical protein
VVAVLAIPRPRSRVEQVVASRDQLDDLEHKKVSNRPIRGDVGTGLTTHATLHISALVPHFAPRITSGQRYCRVWISSVKWCSVQVANETSARLGSNVVSLRQSRYGFNIRTLGYCI